MGIDIAHPALHPTPHASTPTPRKRAPCFHSHSGHRTRSIVASSVRRFPFEDARHDSTSAFSSFFRSYACSFSSAA